MTQPNAEPFIVSGIIQRPLVPSNAPIRCVLATTGRDVAKAQRFWIHPRHAKLYRRVFNAQAIGDPFPCDEVCGSPGQYMRADITRANQFHSRLRDRFQFRTSAGGYSSSSKLSQT